ncbi:hypothetical protein AB0395_17200 [Streptosporangium sp. NPDC051023]|uniref:WXG100-like domain-containing protein n=1 Tax=Streptosporangium sp. NPDC051023 TaxID=3155410 RepID=UPI003450B80D
MDNRLETLVPPIVRPYVGWIVGMDWPEGDEEGCFRLADAYREVAAAITTLIEDGHVSCLDARECMDGAASDAFGEYWKTFTTVDPLVLPRLKQACEKAGDQLNTIGLEIEYAKYMILLSLFLLAAQILYFLRMAVPSGGRSLALVPMACRLTQMTVRQIAMRLLRNIALFSGVMGGMDVLIQSVQMVGGRREDWDWTKTGTSLAGGALAGLTFTGFAAAIGKLGGARITSEMVERVAMSGREKAAAFLDGSALGMATQSMVANTAAGIPMLAASGQLDWEHLAKSVTSGFLGGADGHLIAPTGHRGPDSLAARVGHFPETGNLTALGDGHIGTVDLSPPTAHPANDPTPSVARPATGDPAGPPAHQGAADPGIASAHHDTAAQDSVRPDPATPSHLDGSGVTSGDRAGLPEGQPRNGEADIPVHTETAPAAHPDPRADAPAPAHLDTPGTSHPDAPAAAHPAPLEHATGNHERTPPPPDTLVAGHPETPGTAHPEPRADTPATPPAGTSGHPGTPGTGHPDVLVAARPDIVPPPGAIERLLNPHPLSEPSRAAAHVGDDSSHSTGPRNTPAPIPRDPAAGSVPHDPTASGAVPPREPGDGAPPPADPPRSSESNHDGSDAKTPWLRPPDERAQPSLWDEKTAQIRMADFLNEAASAPEHWGGPRPGWLAGALHSGIDGGPVTLGGRTLGTSKKTWSLLVEKWTFNDGSHIIRKVMESKEEADAEVLASLVGVAIGADVPRVYRADENVVYMEFKEGKFNFLLSADERISRPHLTASGMRISLLDVLVGNNDRHNSNWLVSPEGKIVGIDHNGTFVPPMDWQPRGRFGTQFVRPLDHVTEDAPPYAWTPNSLSPEDVQGVRAALTSWRVRTAFQSLGRWDWYENMLGQLDMIEQNAGGTGVTMPMPRPPTVITRPERNPLDP